MTDNEHIRLIAIVGALVGAIMAFFGIRKWRN